MPRGLEGKDLTQDHQSHPPLLFAEANSREETAQMQEKCKYLTPTLSLVVIQLEPGRGSLSLNGSEGQSVGLPEGEGSGGDPVVPSVLAFPVVGRLVKNPTVASRAKEASPVNQKIRVVKG